MKAVVGRMLHTAVPLHLGVLPYALPQPEADASYGARCVTRSCVTHGHPTPVTPTAIEHNEPAGVAFRMKAIR
jgi:hypothetical protein